MRRFEIAQDALCIFSTFRKKNSSSTLNGNKSSRKAPLERRGSDLSYDTNMEKLAFLGEAMRSCKKAQKSGRIFAPATISPERGRLCLGAPSRQRNLARSSNLRFLINNFSTNWNFEKKVSGSGSLDRPRSFGTFREALRGAALEEM